MQVIFIILLIYKLDALYLNLYPNTSSGYLFSAFSLCADILFILFFQFYIFFS